jgi:hypothetical protein
MKNNNRMLYFPLTLTGMFFTLMNSCKVFLFITFIMLFVVNRNFSQTIEENIFIGIPITNDKISTTELDTVYSNYKLYKISTADINNYTTKAVNNFTLQFYFNNEQNWTIKLKPNDLRSDDYVLRVGTDSGIVEYPRSANCTYKGSLVNDNNSTVWATIKDNYIAFMIVQSNGETTFFETIDKFNKDKSKENIFIVYDSKNIIPRSSINKDSVIQNQNNEKDQNNSEEIPSYKWSNYSRTNGKLAKIALVADWNTVTYVGGGVSGVETEFQRILSYVEYYYNKVNISYQLVQMFVPSTKSASPFDSSTDPVACINELGTYKAFLITQKHSLAAYWTGKELTTGYAWLNCICKDASNNSICDIRSNTSQFNANLASHEIGHNWGMAHCAFSKTMIMSPTVYDGTINWDAASIAAFPSKLTLFSACLTNTTISIEDISNNKNKSVLVFPNPNNGKFTIEYNSNSKQDYVVEIFDIVGHSVYKKVLTNVNDNLSTQVDLSFLTNGIYILNLTTDKENFSKVINKSE